MCGTWSASFGVGREKIVLMEKTNRVTILSSNYKAFPGLPSWKLAGLVHFNSRNPVASHRAPTGFS